MKKKILLTTNNLDVGGVEKALVNFVNNIDFDKYDVTVLLQKKEGDLLKLVKDEVHIEDYHLSQIRFWPIRKMINLIKQIILGMKIYHRYDFSACFGTGYIPSSRMALLASSNNACWMHTNIIKFIENVSFYRNEGLNDLERTKKFLRKIYFRKFKHQIFVSENAIQAYLILYPDDKNKIILCHNYVDGDDILLKSQEKVDDMYSKNVLTFINISRYTEFDKKITRIIHASYRLCKEGYKFQIIMIGDGEDLPKYQKLVQEKKLEKTIHFIGKRVNPFPYLKMADAFLLSSQYEGFPTTYTESLTLNVPIITTDVSDANSFIKNHYGIVVENNDTDIYNGMKEFLENGYKIKNKFDYRKFNKESLEKIYSLVEKKGK